MENEKIKLPISSFGELIRIIKGYHTFTKEVAPKELSPATKMHETAISGNTGFLSSIGILTEGRKKMLTDEGRKLALALTYENSEESKREWRKIISKNEFLQKMVSAVKIRNGIDLASFRAHIAYSAGQPKKSYIMAGAGAVIEILKAAELMKEEDGQLIALAEDNLQISNFDQSISLGGVPSDANIAMAKERDIKLKTWPNQSIALSIQIQIKCTPSDIDQLSGKIKLLIKELSSESEPNTIIESDMTEDKEK
jgi:hypothetical protein